MDVLSAEVLAMVASYLSAIDLGAFRLTGQRYRAAGDDFIPRHGIVIPCVCGISKALNGELAPRVSIVARVQKVTFVLGKWPTFQAQSSWEYYVSARFPRGQNPLRGLSPEHIRNMYNNATTFLAAQRHDVVVRCLKFALQLFRNLVTLKFSYKGWDQHPRLRKIYETTLIMPEDDFDTLTSALVPALSQEYSSKLYNLILEQGTPFSVRQPRASHALLGIQKLHLSFSQNHKYYCLGTHSGTAKSSVLLENFPSLRELFIVSFITIPQVWGMRVPQGPVELGLLVEGLTWGGLESLYLSGIKCSEDELIRLIDRHESLISVGLGTVTLYSGTWNSFFMRLIHLVGKNVNISQLLLDGSLASMDDSRDDYSQQLRSLSDLVKVEESAERKAGTN